MRSVFHFTISSAENSDKQLLSLLIHSNSGYNNMNIMLFLGMLFHLLKFNIMKIYMCMNLIRVFVCVCELDGNSKAFL